MKTCKKCLQSKPQDSYFKAKKNKDGLQSHCKQCDNVRKKAWRYSDLKSYNKKVLEYKNKNKNLINLKRNKWAEKNRDVINEKMRIWWRNRNPIKSKPIIANKKCIQCQQIKDVAKFNKRNSCIACNSKKHARNNREKLTDSYVISTITHGNKKTKEAIVKDPYIIKTKRYLLKIYRALRK
jgi:hypothetical protein